MLAFISASDLATAHALATHSSPGQRRTMMALRANPDCSPAPAHHPESGSHAMFQDAHSRAVTGALIPTPSPHADSGSCCQVAAHAPHHVCVRKVVVEGRVLTSFQHLGSQAEREEELAAMLGMDLQAARQLMASTAAS